MKIAYILPHFYPYVGGGEKMFYDLAKGFAAMGHQVRVVAERVGEDNIGVKKFDGMQVRYCPWKSAFGHPFPRTKDVEDVIKWCDVVHTSIFTTSPIVARLAKKYNKPSVITIYEARGNKWYWCDNFINATAFNIVEQFTCRQRFDVYHAISNATKKDVEKFCGRKNVDMVYIANEMSEAVVSESFDLRKYIGVPASQRVFLYYGRPGKTKGVHIYENAIGLLKKAGAIPEDVTFAFILGAEPKKPREEFIKAVEDDGLTDCVKVVDSVKRDELGAAIKQASYVVVPSLTEGFGFSALEACQLGAKLIYSDGGSLNEVTYGHCVSFKNRDSKDLARKIKAAIKKGDDAFDFVEEKHFTYDAMFEGIMNEYKQAIELHK